MLNFPQGEFHTCLQDKGEIRAGAGFYLGWTCIQKDKIEQGRGQTKPRSEIQPGVKLYV